MFRALAAAVLLLLTASGGAAAAPRLEPVGTFASPVHVNAPDGDAARLFVVEKAGRVQLVANGQRTTFLDVAGITDDEGERGLLSIAFPPDYAASGLFYVFLTCGCARPARGDARSAARCGAAGARGSPSGSRFATPPATRGPAAST